MKDTDGSAGEPGAWFGGAGRGARAVWASFRRLVWGPRRPALLTRAEEKQRRKRLVEEFKSRG